MSTHQTIAPLELCCVTGGQAATAEPIQSSVVGSPGRCAWLPQGIAQHEANKKKLEAEARSNGWRNYLSLSSRAAYEGTNAGTLRKELEGFC